MIDDKQSNDSSTGMININAILDMTDFSESADTKIAGFLTGANYGFFVSTQSPEMMKELVVGFLLVAGGLRAANGPLSDVSKTPHLSVAGLAVGLVAGIGLSRPDLITDYLSNL